MPAKIVERSGLGLSNMTRLKRTHDRLARALSIRHRIHHFAAAVHKIAAGEIFGTASSLKPGLSRQLPNGWYYHVAKQVKIGTGNRPRQSTLCIRPCARIPPSRSAPRDKCE